MLKRACKLIPKQARAEFFEQLNRNLPPKLYFYLMQRYSIGLFYESIQNSKLLFIHVPKVAGSSVTNALYGRSGLGHYRARDMQRYAPDFFASKQSVALVRNPWERLLSAFTFYGQRGTEDVPMMFSKPIPISFSEFVLEWLPKQSIETCNWVFRRQVDFIYDSNGDCLVNKIFDLREMEDFECYVSSIIGKEFNVPHVNKTSVNHAGTIFYTQELIDAVGEIYCSDVEAFNFQPPRLGEL